jgi:hypothetical protein
MGVVGDSEAAAAGASLGIGSIIAGNPVGDSKKCMSPGSCLPIRAALFFPG